MKPILHREVSHLTEANAELRTELADLLALAHDLVHTVKANLLALYQTKLGPWELDRLKVQWRVAKLKRTIELVQASLNRGKIPDMRQIDAQVKEEQALWEAKLKEAASQLQAAEYRMTHLMSAEHNAELKKLYHTLVKQLHPDLHPEQGAGGKMLWQQVQEAYDQSDLEKLRALALLLHEPPKAVGAHDAMEKLQAEHAALEKRIVEQEAKIEQIESQPPFTLREHLDDDLWVATRRAEIEKVSEPLQAQAAALEKHLQTLVPLDVPGIDFGLN